MSRTAMALDYSGTSNNFDNSFVSDHSARMMESASNRSYASYMPYGDGAQGTNEIAVKKIGRKKLSRLDFGVSPDMNDGANQEKNVKSEEDDDTASNFNTNRVTTSVDGSIYHDEATNKGENIMTAFQRYPSVLARSNEILSFEAELLDLLNSASSLTKEQRSSMEKTLKTAFDLFQAPIKVKSASVNEGHTEYKSLIDVASLSLYKRIQGIVTSLSTVIMNISETNSVHESNSTQVSDYQEKGQQNANTNIHVQLSSINTSFDDSINDDVRSMAISNSKITLPVLDKEFNNESLDKLSPLAKNYTRRRPSNSTSYLGSPLKNKTHSLKSAFPQNTDLLKLGNISSRSSSGNDSRIENLSKLNSRLPTPTFSDSILKNQAKNFTNNIANNSKAQETNFEPLLKGNLSDESSEFSDDVDNIATSRRNSQGASSQGASSIGRQLFDPRNTLLTKNFASRNGSMLSHTAGVNNSRVFVEDHFYSHSNASNNHNFINNNNASNSVNLSRLSGHDFETSSPLMESPGDFAADNYPNSSLNLGFVNRSRNRQLANQLQSSLQNQSSLKSPPYNVSIDNKEESFYNASYSPTRRLARRRSKTMTGNVSQHGNNSFMSHPHHNSIIGNPDLLFSKSRRGSNHKGLEVPSNRLSFPGFNYSKFESEAGNGGLSNYASPRLQSQNMNNQDLSYIEGFDESMNGVYKSHLNDYDLHGSPHALNLSNAHTNNDNYSNMFIDMSQNFDYTSSKGSNRGSTRNSPSIFPDHENSIVTNPFNGANASKGTKENGSIALQQQIQHHKQQLKKFEALEKLKQRATSRNSARRQSMQSSSILDNGQAGNYYSPSLNGSIIDGVNGNGGSHGNGMYSPTGSRRNSLYVQNQPYNMSHNGNFDHHAPMYQHQEQHQGFGSPNDSDHLNMNHNMNSHFKNVVARNGRLQSRPQSSMSGRSNRYSVVERVGNYSGYLPHLHTGNGGASGMNSNFGAEADELGSVYSKRNSMRF